MGDEKKLPDFDSEKTIVDLKRPGVPWTPRPEGRTIAPASSEAAPADKTVVISRSGGAPASADLDKTVISPVGRPVMAPPGGAMPVSERTLVQPGGARQAAPGSGFEIVCLSGQSHGRRFAIPEAGALVGSNPTCHVVIAGIETAHVKITRHDEEFEIQNLGAPGSVVLCGGRIVSSGKMKAGDLVKIGDVVLRLVRVGEVFSSDFSEGDFVASALTRLLAPERRLYLAIGAFVVVAALLFLMPSRAPQKVVVQVPVSKSDAQENRQKRVNSLLAAGEVLMKEGRLFAPTDQPDAENAFAKVNEALALDPGNDRALAAMKKIDAERDRQRHAHEEEQRRQEEARRKALEAQVMAAIDRGDELFRKGQVTEPAGNNALVHYRSALKIDPLSPVARDRVQKALGYYVDRGDQARDAGDPWVALENYRKASRAAEGKDPDIEARVRETESHLKSGMAGTDTLLIMYKDDNGRTVVLDDMDKVPARYRDRALAVQPAPGKAEGVR